MSLVCLWVLDSIGQPGIGATKKEVEDYAKINGWTIKEPYHLEEKTTFSERFIYDGKEAMYCFNKIGTEIKCLVLIIQFSSPSEYSQAKQSLNINQKTPKMHIPSIPSNVKTFGVTAKGVDFYRGFDDDSMIVLKGIGRKNK